MLYYFRRRLLARRVSKKMQFALASGTNHFVVVYDNLVSPPTIGDFIWVVMLARFIAKKRFTVDFHLINGEYRQDWSDLSREDISRYLAMQISLIQQFTLNLNVKIKVMGWREHVALVEAAKVYETDFVWNDRVSRRLPIYNHSFNALNYLLSSENKNFLDEFLLNTADFENAKPKEIPSYNYVTWHARYNLKWGAERNSNERDFLNYFYRIKQQNGCKKIILVSDLNGCEYYAKLAVKYDLDLEYSKSFGESFFNDCFLVLNSDFYYQFKGGGMGVVPMLSSQSYEIVGKFYNEIHWKYPQATSFSTPAQKYFFDILELDKNFYFGPI